MGFSEQFAGLWISVTQFLDQGWVTFLLGSLIAVILGILFAKANPTWLHSSRGKAAKLLFDGLRDEAQQEECSGSMEKPSAPRTVEAAGGCQKA